jgi:hypothetical protein
LTGQEAIQVLFRKVKNLNLVLFSVRTTRFDGMTTTLIIMCLAVFGKRLNTGLKEHNFLQCCG